MALKASYDTQEAVPAEFKAHYVEKDGKWVVEVEGAPSADDLKKVSDALAAERTAHSETANKLKPFDTIGKTPDEIKAAMVELEEAKTKLEAGGGEKFDQAKYDELVDRKVALQIEPLNRQIEALTTERDAAKTEATNTKTQLTRRDLGTELNAAATAEKMPAEAIPFFVNQALDQFEKSEADGRFLTVRKDGSDTLPGLTPAQMVAEAKKTMPFLWPDTTGAGIKPGEPGGPDTTNNPWMPGAAWNKSEQSRIHNEKGPDEAKRLSQAAGAGDNPYIVRHPKDVEAQKGGRAA